MNVLYINYLFDKKYSSVGAAVHVKEFMHAASQTGLKVKSYDLNKFDSEEAAAESKSRAWLKEKLSRYVGQLNTVVSNIGYFRREWRIVKGEKPDALLVRYNYLNFSLAIIAWLKKIPLVLEVNSPMALEDRLFNKKQWHLPFIPEWAEKLNLRLANRVYTVSQALRAHFVSQGIDAKKISVVPNGVDVARFRPDLSGEAIRRKHGLSNMVVLGFVGSFHYWHGVECLDEYIEKLCQKYDNLGFLLVGDGPMRAELESTFKEKPYTGKIAFPGYVEHDVIPAYLAAMDIVLAPYPELTFFYFSPLKLFEYMAAGKAVVASKVGQIEEMVEDGVNGFLYTAGDMKQFVARSSQLIESESLRKNIGQQARETVCANYSWKINAEKVIGLLRDSVNGEQVDKK